MRLLLPGNCEFCTNPCDFFCSVLDCYAWALNGRTHACLRWGVRCMHVTQLKKNVFNPVHLFKGKRCLIMMHVK